MSDPELINYRFYSSAKVRFAETDANGHMSHVTAVIYMEMARCDFLSALGFFDQDQMIRDGKTFVLAKQSVDYKRQAYYNDTLDTYCYVSRIGTSSINIDYVIIHRDTKAVICTGTSTVVHFDSKAQKSTPLPADLPERIAKLQSEFVGK